MTGIPDETPPATMATCPHCGAPLEAGDKFCEACGKPLSEGAAPAGPVTAKATDLDDVSPVSAVTAQPGRTSATAAAAAEPGGAGERAPCRECGGVVGDDGYCTRCGTKAPSARDHFEERPADWVAGVCDRGIRHSRNEDAMALSADGDRAVLVVCDGVSNSDDSDIASLAASKAALRVFTPRLPKGLGVPESAAAAVTQVFTAAAAAANQAVVDTAPDDVANPPSSTFIAAILEDGVVHHCGIGDSRVYLLPDQGEGQILTVDDSMAQVLIAGGMPRAEAEASKQAHSIVKWLGRDSPDFVPRVGSIEVTSPGWLLACTDGLWNYASEPSALQGLIRAAGSGDPQVIATHLVAFANSSGGQDNITAALARVGGPLPLVQQGVQAVPLVEEGAQAVPLVEEGAQAVPLVEEGAQEVPLVEEGAQAVPLVEEGALAVPLVEEGALAPVSKPAGR